MKTCVFITGTNAVGKSALAWEIIHRYGGVDRITNDVTYCCEGGMCLAGPYGTHRYGGVDRITNDKGSSCTSRLAEVVREGLKHADTIICEGSFMSSFGINLTNALFVAEQHLVVNLYAEPETIYRRLLTRSDGKNGAKRRRIDQTLQRQKQSMISARRWQSIGVKVLQFNTSKTTIKEEFDAIRSFLEKGGNK